MDMLISNNSFKDYLEISLYINVKVLQVINDNEVKFDKIIIEKNIKNYGWI